MFSVFVNKQGVRNDKAKSSLTHIVFLLLMIAFFNGCQETLVEPEANSSNSTIVNKIDPDPKILDAHAYGVVYDGIKPAKYATVS